MSYFRLLIQAMIAIAYCYAPVDWTSGLRTRLDGTELRAVNRESLF